MKMYKPVTLLLAGSLMMMNMAEAQLQYPVTKTVEQTDDYFGTKVADPYRWLEDDKSAETKEWVTAQNIVTQGYLSKIPYRKNFQDAIEKVFNPQRKTAVDLYAGRLLGVPVYPNP